MGEATSSDEEDIFDDPYELEGYSFFQDDIYLDLTMIHADPYKDLNDDDYVVFKFSLTSF